MDKIYEILTKEYKLKSTHIRIIKKLINKEYTVRELSKATKIPIGSIYDLLNELLDYKLILEKRGTSKIYYIDDIEQNILNFSDNAINKYTNAREELLSNILHNKNQLTAFNSYSDFKLECLKQEPNPTIVDGFISNYQFPIFFFPEDKKMYFEYKKQIFQHLGQDYSRKEFLVNSIHKSKYHELQKKDVKFRWIINNKEFNDLLKIIKHISLKEYNEFKKRINLVLDDKNIDIRITNDSKDYQFIITNKTLQFQLRVKPMFIGMVITDSETIDVYRKTFNSVFSKSKKIKKFK